jgi:hypothetical protein
VICFLSWVKLLASNFSLHTSASDDLVDLVDLVDSCIMSLKSTLINFTNDQNAQLFVIALVTTQFKTEDEKVVAKDKANLEKQILLNESKARIQAITAGTLTKSSVMYLTNDNDDDEESDRDREWPTEVAKENNGDL